MPKLWRNTPGILMKTIPQVIGKRNCRCKGIIRKSICKAPQFVVRMCLPWGIVEFNWKQRDHWLISKSIMLVHGLSSKFYVPPSPLLVDVLRYA